MTLPTGAPASAWNPANDFSYQGLTVGNANTVKTKRIPVFKDGEYFKGDRP
jgi:hypothetical protein